MECPYFLGSLVLLREDNIGMLVDGRVALTLVLWTNWMSTGILSYGLGGVCVNRHGWWQVGWDGWRWSKKQGSGNARPAQERSCCWRLMLLSLFDTCDRWIICKEQNTLRDLGAWCMIDEDQRSLYLASIVAGRWFFQGKISTRSKVWHVHSYYLKRQGRYIGTLTFRYLCTLPCNCSTQIWKDCAYRSLCE